MAETHPRLAETFAEVARTINRERSLEDTLVATTTVAAQTVPGFTHVGVTLTHRDATVQTKAATDDLAHALDEAQYELREGPCFDAVVERRNILVHDMRHEQRWPAFTKQAIAAGITAQMGIFVYDDAQTIGALNFYSTTGEGIDPEAPGIAEIFATHAAIALGAARTESNLNIALGTRKMVGQAVGILMERYQIDDARAFEFLIRVSSTSNMKLRDVAEELVTQTSVRYSTKETL